MTKILKIGNFSTKTGELFGRFAILSFLLLIIDRSEKHIVNRFTQYAVRGFHQP